MARFIASVFLLLFLSGCVRFTERDYELQEKAYQRQKVQEEVLDKEKIRFRW